MYCNEECMKRIVVAVLLISFIFFFGCHKKREHEIGAKAVVKQNVEILPGIGIIVNKDTVYLEKTTARKLQRMFNVKTESSPHREDWSGSTWSGEGIGGSRYATEYSYGTIYFKFSDEKSLKKIALRQIFILDVNKYNVSLYNQSLNRDNIGIRTLFSRINAEFVIRPDSLFYFLPGYGIGLRLAEKNDFSLIKQLDIIMPEKSTRH
jgi:hypothetical protein